MPEPNPLDLPAVQVDEVQIKQQQQQHGDDSHVEFLWAQQLPRSDFVGSYSIAAIAVTECGEWWSPRFIVRNH